MNYFSQSWNENKDAIEIETSFNQKLKQGLFFEYKKWFKWPVTKPKLLQNR